MVVIKVSESLEVPGAFSCEHLGFVNGSTQPGDLVLCEKCEGFLTTRTTVVDESGKPLKLDWKQDAEGHWQISPRAAKAGQ